MIVEKLIKRRNELALQVRELNANLAHLDATIKLLQADVRIEKLEMKRGSLSRDIFKILREAEAPLSTRDIAIKILGANHPELDFKVKNIGTALLHNANKGTIKATKGEGNSRLWEIVK